jgi:hypothetical protein
MNRKTAIVLTQCIIIILATVISIGFITDWAIFNIYEDEPILLVAKIMMSAGIFLIATAVAISIRGVAKEALYERIERDGDMSFHNLTQYDAVVVDHLPKEGESCTFYILTKEDLSVHVFLYIKSDEKNDNVNLEWCWRYVGEVKEGLPWRTYEQVKRNNIHRFKYSVPDEKANK